MLVKALDKLPKEVNIVNLSINILDMDGEPNYELLKKKIKQLTESGVIIVAASGNGYDNCVFSPANMENVIAVTALERIFKNDEKYRIIDQANYGKEVDICSIGSNILSCGKDKDVVSMSGTSMSTAYISGLIALRLQLLMDKKLPIDPKEIIKELKNLNFGYANKKDIDNVLSAILGLKIITGVPENP